MKFKFTFNSTQLRYLVTILAKEGKTLKSTNMLTSIDTQILKDLHVATYNPFVV